MKCRHILSLFLSIFLFNSSSYAIYKVHEWGTFTSLVGSDGRTQPGLYHEDEKLPDFVYGYGAVQSKPAPLPPAEPSPDDRFCKSLRCNALQSAGITQKMETPVIYFYSDIERSVDVRVKFPNGVVTETFPAPIATFPQNPLGPFKNGDTSFRVDVLKGGYYNLPYVKSDNIYSHARKVNSNFVRTNKDYEKFIFYRGLGQFQPTLKITSSEKGLSIRNCIDCEAVDHVFLVHVNANGESNLMRVKLHLRHTGFQEAFVRQDLVEAMMKHPSQAKTASGADALSTLSEALMQSGLYQDEAQAMVKTWENGYLKVPGLRLLYILSSQEVESFLPLEVKPQPEELKRVFVGRIEIMQTSEEAAVLKSVLADGLGFNIQTLGRFAEPRLRRIKEVYLMQIENDPAVRTTNLKIIDQLIARAVGGVS